MKFIYSAFVLYFISILFYMILCTISVPFTNVSGVEGGRNRSNLLTAYLLSCHILFFMFFASRVFRVFCLACFSCFLPRVFFVSFVAKMLRKKGSRKRKLISEAVRDRFKRRKESDKDDQDNTHTRK